MRKARVTCIQENYYIFNRADYLSLYLNPGTALYSPVYGEVRFKRLYENEPKIEVETKSGLNVRFYLDGKLSQEGEIVLFPKRKGINDWKDLNIDLPTRLDDPKIKEFLNKEEKMYSQYNIKSEIYSREQYNINTEELERRNKIKEKRVLEFAILKDRLHDAAKYYDSHFESDEYPNHETLYGIKVNSHIGMKKYDFFISPIKRYDLAAFIFGSSKAAEAFLKNFEEDLYKYFSFFMMSCNRRDRELIL